MRLRHMAGKVATREFCYERGGMVNLSTCTYMGLFFAFSDFFFVHPPSSTPNLKTDNGLIRHNFKVPHFNLNQKSYFW